MLRKRPRFKSRSGTEGRSRSRSGKFFGRTYNGSTSKDISISSSGWSVAGWGRFVSHSGAPSNTYSSSG